jgi:hypothetical protein
MHPAPPALVVVLIVYSSVRNIQGIVAGQHSLSHTTDLNEIGIAQDTQRALQDYRHRPHSKRQMTRLDDFIGLAMQRDSPISIYPL